MSDLLSRLDAWLRAHRSAYYEHLQPGLDSAALAGLQRALGQALPPDLAALYAWHNGQQETYGHSLFHNFTFMPADDIVDTVTTLNDLLDAGHFDRDNWWHPQWIPFLDNGAGDCYCVDMAGCFDGAPGQVLIFYHDWENRDVEYPSLAAWLEVFVYALEQGLLLEDEYGIQPVDPDAFDALRAELNPGYPRDAAAG